MNNRTGVTVSAAAFALALPLVAQSRSIPSVVVTVENAAPSRGAFQTPVWVGIHDGSFDIYDRDVPLGADGLVPAPAVERLAEDGATGPISDEFSIALPFAPQATLVGPSGPLAPGDRSSITLNVDPSADRYFSYASMVIPSNDAFIANGSPVAHELFDGNGNFVGEDFVVTGTEILDAGTEFNDEEAGNTAFLNQGGPDIGVPEDGTVVLHPGFRTDLFFPDGVLNHPTLGFADFLNPDRNYRAARVTFRYVDLGERTVFRSFLDPDQEVSGSAIISDGVGSAFATARNGEQVFVSIRFRNLSGPVVAAHLHAGAGGTNGPVVVDLSDEVRARTIRTVIRRSDVTGPFGTDPDPFRSLLNAMAAGNIYINLHTAENPDGEIRGQIELR